MVRLQTRSENFSRKSQAIHFVRIHSPESITLSDNRFRCEMIFFWYLWCRLNLIALTVHLRIGKRGKRWTGKPKLVVYECDL